MIITNGVDFLKWNAVDFKYMGRKVNYLFSRLTFGYSWSLSELNQNISFTDARCYHNEKKVKGSTIQNKEIPIKMLSHVIKQLKFYPARWGWLHRLHDVIGLG